MYIDVKILTFQYNFPKRFQRLTVKFECKIMSFEYHQVHKMLKKVLDFKNINIRLEANNLHHLWVRAYHSQTV